MKHTQNPKTPKPQNPLEQLVWKKEIINRIKRKKTMSDSDSDNVKVEDPLPPHRVRFTDMPQPLVSKAIRRKWPIPNPSYLFVSFH